MFLEITHTQSQTMTYQYTENSTCIDQYQHARSDLHEKSIADLEMLHFQNEKMLPFIETLKKKFCLQNVAYQTLPHWRFLLC